DEIGTELEALAARTIAERGVQLVGTAHGNRLENLIKNPTLADLVGGIQAVTLGDEEARRRGSQKTVLERKALPTFTIAVEMLERQKWVIHANVAQTIDLLLRGKEPGQEIRAVSPEGEIEVSQIVAPDPVLPTLDALTQAARPKGLRASGRMAPLAPLAPKETWLEPAWMETTPNGEKARTPGPNGEDLPVYVYPYGVGRAQLEQVITVLNLPIVLTKDLQHADAVLALRSHLKHHPKLKSLVQEQNLPIYGLKSNGLAQISRTLKQILGMDDPKQPEAMDLRLFTRGDEADELEALEEARLAVEQIVIPTGQPVELLPRNAKVRKMQHELVEHYRLHSDSLGEEPHRRLRIYPA
ncbi:MAG: R3H domain-containing nucleic acid-binding protein, partial [Cyanobacteriota bacterium]|nr:R3H domain-containing nucleic acid-binding protein [Cyanobacteriota bacterium]